MTKDELSICVFATIYECVIVMMKSNLSIEQMKKLVIHLDKYVEAEESRMK